jgi:hypothetical protein
MLVVRYMHIIFPTEKIDFNDKVKWILIYRHPDDGLSF